MGVGRDDAEVFELVFFDEVGADLLAEGVGIFGPEDVVVVGVGFIDAGGGDEDVVGDGEVDVEAGGVGVGEVGGGLLRDEVFFAAVLYFGGAALVDGEDFAGDEDEVAVLDFEGVDDVPDFVFGGLDNASFYGDEVEIHEGDYTMY